MMFEFRSVTQDWQGPGTWCTELGNCQDSASPGTGKPVPDPRDFRFTGSPGRLQELRLLSGRLASLAIMGGANHSAKTRSVRVPVRLGPCRLGVRY